jgi:DNA-binding Lrp family transcriptional regulator
MQTIFVQIKCDLGMSYRVAEATIDEVEGVSEVHSTSGQYDLIVKCHLDEGTDIGHFVTETIQKLPGVKDTHTIIAFKAFS